LMQSVCIGVDVGGTNLRCALVDRNGVILRRASQATDIASGRAPFLSRLTQLINRLQCEAEVLNLQVAAVGLGIPGLIANDGMVRSSVNLLPLEGVNLAEIVSAGIGLPVLSLNDANAAAVAEQRFGAGKPFASFLMLTLGTGVGAGLVLDGKLWTGIDGSAGEFGHITVEPDGRLCGCGNRGCLEQYASATAIADFAALDAANGKGQGCAETAKRALKGDPAAVAIFQRAGNYLGIAAAGVLNLLNLEAIVLGGGVAESFELLAAPMLSEIAARAFAIPAARVRVVKGELGDDAGVLGAAASALDALKLL
jgi:glucokinase